MSDEMAVSKKRFDGTCTFCGVTAQAVVLPKTAMCSYGGSKHLVSMFTLSVSCGTHRYLALDYDSEVEDPFEEGEP